jgi:hypothetical protein
MGHHRLEPVPPMAVAVASSLFAYKNLQTHHEVRNLPNIVTVQSEN